MNPEKCMTGLFHHHSVSVIQSFAVHFLGGMVSRYAGFRVSPFCSMFTKKSKAEHCVKFIFRKDDLEIVTKIQLTRVKIKVKIMHSRFPFTRNSSRGPYFVDERITRVTYDE